MNIKIGSDEFELVKGNQLAQGDVAYLLKPVKKTENKEAYTLQFGTWDQGQTLFSEALTETQAHKLSEAISALVEYVHDNKDLGESKLISKAVEAKELFQEDQ